MFYVCHQGQVQGGAELVLLSRCTVHADCISSPLAITLSFNAELADILM